jgi:tRNA(Ile)-lysidine synthetase-like protein
MEFYKDWFEHPEYWFQASGDIDAYLTKKYIGLLDETWDSSIKDIRYHLQHLMVHDQLVRHIYRGMVCHHIIDYHLQKAIDIHYHIKQHSSVIFDLNDKEWCFWGLPIRHSKKVPAIHQLIKDTWYKIQWEQSHGRSILYLKRFLQASYQRMPMDDQQLQWIDYFPNNQSISFDTFFQYIPILDYCPIQSKLEPYTSYLIQPIRKFIQKHKLSHLIVSLSGGVDSMVCSYLLKQLSQSMNLKVYAFSIHYCNRTDMEAKFVQDWCQYIQLPLYMRSFNEITRAPCMNLEMRDTYESYTRDVRYQCYKTVWKEMGQTGTPYVLMGHNEDDCLENILTNLCHQHKYENLRGMKSYQIVNEIGFCRPLLKIQKEWIYQEAHKLGIPYLKDSTPSWSQRGQIRDKVRPVLEQWDKQMIPSLFQLSKVMKEAEVFKQKILTEWKQKTICSENVHQIKIDIEEAACLSCQSLWFAYFVSYHIYLKKKSIQHFVKALKSSVEKKTFGRFILSKEISATYHPTSGMLQWEVPVCSRSGRS